MKKYDSNLRQFIEQGDTMQAYQYQRENTLNQLNAQKVHKELVQEITKEVLAQIKVSIDVSDAIMQIEKLNNAIKSIGK